MSRRVEVRAVGSYYWSTRALAWGVDTRTHERVSFVLPLDDEATLRQQLAVGAPVVEVDDVDVLLIRPRVAPAL